jgi:hypothetical protein
VLLDIILDFALIPAVIFVFVLFMCDLEEWDKMKQEVDNIFAAASYITALALACLNLLLLFISSIATIGGDYGVSLIFDIVIMLFAGLSVTGLFVSEYWKRKLRG